MVMPLNLTRITNLPWKRIFLLTGLAALLLVLLFFAYVERSRYLWVAGEHRTYNGLTLGMTREEARYAFGYPDAVIAPAPAGAKGWDAFDRVLFTDDHDPQNQMPADKTINDYNEWTLTRNEAQHEVYFDPKTGRVVAVGCLDNNRLSQCPALHGIWHSMSEDQVIGALGQPDSQKLGEGAKTMQWDDLGLIVVLTERRVYWVRKIEPKASAWQAFTRHFLF